MQSLKKFYFGKQKAKVNTYIGGIGGTINTPALLASRLGISENRIKLFKLTGLDIECAIVGTYSLTAGLREGGLLTYFIDKDGLATTFGALQNFVGQSNMHTVYAPKTTYMRGAVHYNSCSNLKIFYAPLCTTLGEYGSSNNFVGQSASSHMFWGASNNLKMYLHPSIQTVNNGAVDPDIIEALAYGVLPQNIRYVTNFTPPNAITNLSAGQIYSTAIQLNFTPPSSTNQIEFYEVYFNGSRIPKVEITANGEFITGLTPLTNYNITVVAVDIFYNKSVVSNVINASTNTIDNDSSLYIAASSNQAYETQIINLFTSLKSSGLYYKIQAFYPFLGTSASQHKWNAKNTQDTNSAFRLQFFGGGTHSNLGYQCNGTNAYANTYLVPNAAQNLNSNGLTISIGTNNAVIGSESIDIGSYTSDASTSFIATKAYPTTNNRLCGMNGNSPRINIPGISEARGIYTGTKTASNIHKLWRNGVQLGTGIGGGILPSIPIWIGALNFNSTIYGPSPQRIQFAAIHDGLSDTEVQTLHTIIDEFETAIGRKTW